MLQSGELREMLERAEAIQRQSEHGSYELDMQALVKAAEEAGIDAEALQQALRERMGSVAEPPAIGDKVFARSSDGRFYVAHALGVSPSGVLVRFAQGSEASIPLAEIKPFHLLPGQRVNAKWPNWGWWNSTVLHYDPYKELVGVTDNCGYDQILPLTKIRLNAPKTGRRSWPMRQKIAIWLLTAAASGGAIGSLVTWLLTR